jgi:hypothetical protein
MRVNVLSNAALGLSNDPGWAGEAPLWFYILKEAELPPNNAERLGAVGGRIIAEVLVGLLQRDPNSYLYLDPAWKPAPPLAATAGQFTFGRPAAIRGRRLALRDNRTEGRRSRPR